MVKIQNPVPKKLGNKPKLDNPIKKKKHQITKEKPTASVKNIKAKLLESPIKEAKATNKPAKEVQNKKDKQKSKGPQKELSKSEAKLAAPLVQQMLKEETGTKKKSKKADVKGMETNGKKKKDKSSVAPVEAKVAVLVDGAAPVKGKATTKTVKSVAPVEDAAPIKMKGTVETNGTKKVKTAVPAPVEANVAVHKRKASTKTVKSVAAVEDAAPIVMKGTVETNGKKKVKKSSGAAPVEAKVPILIESAVPVKAKTSGKITKAVKSNVSVKAAGAIKVKTLKEVKSAIPAAKVQTQSQKLAPVPVSKPELPTTGPITLPAAQKGKKKKNNIVKKATLSDTDAPPTTKEYKLKAKLQEKKKAKIAFRLAQKKANSDPEKKKEKQEKKEKLAAKSARYEPVPYEEEKFNAIVNVENILKIVEALKTQVEKEVALKKSSIFDDYRYLLQVGSFKIASCPKRMVKLNLKHPLADKDDDVLLVVTDLKRGFKVDYEPTIHHYEDLLRYHGIEGLTVMPMNQLRKEFTSYEQKRRLVASYEHFLCDGRIVSHVASFIGKFAQKPRKTFHAVRIHEDKDIKAEIEKSLRRTAFRQLKKSSLHTIPVGTHKFTFQQLAENIECIVGQLKKIFPGGLSNIRNLYLKIDISGTSALPLFISMAQPPEQTPMVVGPREQRMIKLKREANEVLSNFAMTKEGKLIKLTKTQAENKRKLMETKAALKEDAKKAKKSKKAAVVEEKKDDVKDLELPENEEDEDDDDSSDDDDDAVQLGSGSDDDEEDNDDMGQLDQDEDDEDAESETEIVENGLVEEGEDESEDEDQQEVDGGDNDDDEDHDDDEEDNEDDDEEDEGDEESD